MIIGVKVRILILIKFELNIDDYWGKSKKIDFDKI